ncbi:FeoA family protein [Echinimonas agarilytica]|uniref:Ferrous iron transport protein A n=1 Tax=Echinimonas agarilytica TaxID=1215918 RepID=A0AA42B7I5_9GAMM|nr:FeoA family protein [Echinimonas agarilytica]MCM2679358.1 ferrous iron transport protein A [Echinimonas agarilytica]
MTLDRLKPHQKALIRAIQCKQPARGKLMDLGLVPGAAVTYVRSAPYGAGCQIEVKRTQLMLRDDVAKEIEVQLA